MAEKGNPLEKKKKMSYRVCLSQPLFPLDPRLRARREEHRKKEGEGDRQPAQYRQQLSLLSSKFLSSGRPVGRGKKRNRGKKKGEGRSRPKACRLLS